MNRRRWLALVLVFSLTLLGKLAYTYKYYFWPKRFAIVEDGQIYRGGAQKPCQMRWILKGYHIKTVLNVGYNPKKPDQYQQDTIAREMGVAMHSMAMPGTGLGTYAQLEEAADILADAAQRPVFVQCCSGVYRTGMVLAAYRLKHCGWTLDQAFREMERHGLNRAKHRRQLEHLQGYVAHVRSETVSTASHCASESAGPN